jgi:hypothetical protein
MVRRLACAAAVVLFASTLGAEPLQYRLPPGWVDLADPATAVAGYPANAVKEARSGKYRIYAIEPETALPQGATALMNVLELDLRGRMTDEVLRRAADQAVEQARTMHYELVVLDKRLAKLGDIDIGIVDSTLGNAGVTMRLRQYFVPGSPKSAIITYGCSPAQFDHYRPTFESSAMATTGAHAGGFELKSAMRGAFIGALIGALIGGVVFATKKASSKPVAPAAAPAITWECPSCHRRVPLRIGECRCGTLRPA